MLFKGMTRKAPPSDDLLTPLFYKRQKKIHTNTLERSSSWFSPSHIANAQRVSIRNTSASSHLEFEPLHSSPDVIASLNGDTFVPDKESSFWVVSFLMQWQKSPFSRDNLNKWNCDDMWCGKCSEILSADHGSLTPMAEDSTSNSAHFQTLFLFLQINNIVLHDGCTTAAKYLELKNIFSCCNYLNSKSQLFQHLLLFRFLHLKLLTDFYLHFNIVH